MKSVRQQRLEERRKKAEEQRLEKERIAKEINDAKAKLQSKKQKVKKKQETKNRLRRKINMRVKREDIKNDPHLYELKKKEERERYHRRKQEGKIKTRGEMSRRELKVIRCRVKESTRRYRRKKLVQQSTELQDNPDDEFGAEILENVPLTTRAETLRLRGRKKKSASRTAAHKKVKKVQEENAALKRALWRSQKRLTNARKKIPLSPKSQINKEMRGKKINPVVKGKLILGEVLKRQVTESFSVKGNKIKGAAYKIFRGSLLKKYKLKGASGLSPKMLKKYSEKNMCPFQNSRARRQHSINKKADVEKFFCSDDNSIECADKRAVKICFGKNRVTKRKRYLKGRMSDLYLSYIQSDEKPVSYSTFCKFKPFYVVMKDLKERDTCLCTKCENMELLMQSLWQAGISPVSTNLSLLRSLCCSPRTDDCLQRKCNKCKTNEVAFRPCENENVEVNLSKWETLPEMKIDSKTGVQKETKRNFRRVKKVSIQALKKIYPEELEIFLDHSFKETHQTRILRNKRENLTSGEMYIWMDYSENYSCKFSREVQNHFYAGSRDNVSLHTGVLYLEGQKHSFCTASESTRKDPPATIAHLIPIFEKFLKPGVTKLHFQSDSPSTQYRNKVMFFLTTQYIPMLYPQITSIVYNYTEAGHGKGAPDGVGAMAKTTLDNAVQSGLDMESFKSAVELLKSKSKTVYIEEVDPKKMTEIDKMVPSDLKPFNGTFSVHQFTWTKEYSNKLHMNNVSCYNCTAGSSCIHYKLKYSPWVLFEQAGESDENTPTASPSPPKRKRKSKVASFCNGDWVAVKYGAHWYPGFVQKVNPQNLLVDFLVKHQRKNDLFLWPSKPDVQTVLKQDVMYKLTEQPRAVDRTLFKVPEHDFISSLML
ncbi:hypothetical protein FOCC_FOCC002583 [Frankliniella occidentalis]|uniref:Uncharacterized protein LOC113201806 n=1 Tax=Frankliniella occidentalis TaxID=133901 RepID=A0A6J1RQZ6_FRAOC|nr:uncharacterized protein LOC113201806 [Frankliniella occidentalis]KAE8750603.1 hypothetical protein FOCC_FOCC002583 [Frankliniella occidentalis]